MVKKKICLRGELRSLSALVTNCNRIVKSIDVLPPVSYNDHHTVAAKLDFKFRYPTAYQRLMWQFDHGDFDTYRHQLSQVNWEDCFSIDDIDIMADKWTELLLKVARDTIPHKIVTVRPWDKPFYNGYLRKLKRHKDRLHKRAKEDNTPYAWLQFRQMRNFYFSEIKQHKLNHEQKLISNLQRVVFDNPRKWWNYSRRILNK